MHMTVRQTKALIRAVNIAALAIALLILVFNSIYFIQEQEQAVVVTLGKPATVMTPGPHFKIPFIQNVHIVPMVINSFSIGYRSVDNSPANYYNSPYGTASRYTDEPVTSESMMITSDYNFVNVDFFLEYQVSDPERYLFASQDPVTVLRNLALSYIRDTIGLHGVDEVITTGKNEIQSEIREKLANRLIQEDIGMQLVNITIQDSEPPPQR